MGVTIGQPKTSFGVFAEQTDATEKPLVSIMSINNSLLKMIYYLYKHAFVALGS